jgi:hypothetical protein
MKPATAIVRRQLTALAILIALSALRAGVARGEELLPPETPIHEAIDHYIDQRLSESDVTPAPSADDANLLRRTMLDLVGRPPTVGEVQSYLPTSDPEKRTQLVDRLMGSPAFVRHQAEEFDALLMEGVRGDVREYLTAALREGYGWDRVFRDLLTGESEFASGDESSNDQSKKVARSAGQFLRSRAGDLDKLANDTSVIFFGVNVSCARCHDHPLVPDWTQEHFFGMKSFFSRTFENGDFVGERDYGFVSYKTVSGKSMDARLMFLTGALADEPPAPEPSEEEQKQEKKRLEELKKNKQPPPPPAFSRRAQLVEVALRPGENRYFSRAVVNQLFARLLGRGLVAPLDQMHPENLPSHPELLDWLARDFVDHGYDVRRLMRGIVLSRAYARSSRWDEEGRQPSRSLFAVGIVRPLTPRQYAMTLRLASASPDQFPADVSPEDLERRMEVIENSARGLSDLFERPGRDFQVGVGEALLLSNGERIERELLRDSGETLVGKLKTIDDPTELIETAVWNVYGRPPSSDEVQVLTEFLATRQDRPLEARRDLVWALLASSECRFNY